MSTTTSNIVGSKFQVSVADGHSTYKVDEVGGDFAHVVFIYEPDTNPSNYRDAILQFGCWVSYENVERFLDIQNSMNVFAKRSLESQ